MSSFTWRLEKMSKNFNLYFLKFIVRFYIIFQLVHILFNFFLNAKRVYIRTYIYISHILNVNVRLALWSPAPTVQCTYVTNKQTNIRSFLVSVELRSLSIIDMLFIANNIISFIYWISLAICMLGGGVRVK